MKKCKCGFNYSGKKDLEMVNLIQSTGIVKYYCPDCKTLKITEKFEDNKNLNSENEELSEVTICFVDNLYKNKKDVLWYGGLVCRVIYKDFIFNIVANGDVRGSIYKNGEELTHFKDKSNNGVFYDVVSSYLPEIQNDENLYSILNSDMSSEEIKAKNLTAIVLDNNNWWEVVVNRVVDGSEGEFIDSFTIDISDSIDECIDYIINEKDNLYTHFLEY